jgi:hypothetical protein
MLENTIKKTYGNDMTYDKLMDTMFAMKGGNLSEAWEKYTKPIEDY